MSYPIKIDLITGFLGSGKTTFIRKYARHLISRGLRTGILVSDHGAVNVDMMMLSKLRSDKCEIETIAGACDDDCHARRFKTKLISMAMSGYDRVVIEPSGVFDIDEFLDLLHDEPLDRWYEIGSVLTIVDSAASGRAGRDDRDDRDGQNFEQDYFLASQAACAGRILMSKTGKQDPATISSSIERLIDAGEKIKLRRDLRPLIITTDWDDFTSSDYDDLMNAGYFPASFVKMMKRDSSRIDTIYLLDNPISPDNLLRDLDIIFSGKYGNIMRIKGFLRADRDSEEWLELNATPDSLSITQVSDGQQVLIIIGTELKNDEITALLC